MQIISRKQALALGLTHYFTGKPCPHGHINKRTVSDYSCLTCKTKKHGNWVNRNRKAVNDYQYHRYYERTKDRPFNIDRATRNKARTEGLTQYLSIRPCKQGHIGLRYLNGVCVVCKQASEAMRKLKNPDAYLKVRRQYSETYRHTHREKERARQRRAKRDAYLADPRKILDRNRDWRQRNIIKVLVRNDRRMALELGADGVLTADEREELLAQAKRCYYCAKSFGRGRPKTLDHVQALTKGGKNDRFNIVVACRKCNTSKGNRPFHPIAGQGILL